MSNPYSPPVVDSGPSALQGFGDDLEAQIAATRPTALVKAAIGTTAATAGLLLLSGIYFGMGFTLFGLPVLVYFVVAGVAELFLTFRLARQRVWAAVAALILSLAITLASGIWMVLLLLSGFIALMNLVLPLVALASAVLVAISIPTCLRTAQIRRALDRSGTPVDF